MTLGETNRQIQQQETKLAQLKEEKHQLFLQLKKVLNEDDIRRRQKERYGIDCLGQYPQTPNLLMFSVK
jgi:G protein pathway suppressor 2